MRFLGRVFLSSWIGLFCNPGWAAVNLIDQNDWKVFFGGFVEMDAITDSTKSLTEVPGNGPISRPGTNAGDAGRTQFSMRNSRLNLGVLPPLVGGWATKGFIEVDFLGYDPAPGSAATNSESSFFTNPTLRIRHAFFSAEADGWQILVGQAWTLFGWQPYYLPNSVSPPPMPGILYERTPQLTLIKSVDLSHENSLQAGISISRPAQRDAILPNVDAGVRALLSARQGAYVSPSGDLKAQPASIALSGTFRDFSTPPATAGASSTRYPSGALAVDLMVPLLAVGEDGDFSNGLTLTGEYSIGQGFGDQFPSWTGGLAQLLNSKTNPNYPNLDAGQGGFDSGNNFNVIKMRSFNLSLQYHLPSELDAYITLGYAQLTAGNVAPLSPVSGVPYDQAQVAWFNFYHNFSEQIRAAFEISYFNTHYVDGVSAHNLRGQLSGWFRF